MGSMVDYDKYRRRAEGLLDESSDDRAFEAAMTARAHAYAILSLAAAIAGATAKDGADALEKV